jgi:hypothetical protein
MSDLRCFLTRRSLAIIGAADDPQTIRGRLLVFTTGQVIHVNGGQYMY